VQDVDAGEEAHDSGLQVKDIDAHWLQRRIRRSFPTMDDDETKKKVNLTTCFFLPLFVWYMKKEIYIYIFK
jgi:N-terminal helicase PWI domain